MMEMNCFPMFDSTAALYGGLNQMILRRRVRLRGVGVAWYLISSLYPLSLSALL